ncbi:MAG TPA: phospholipase D-like domain-containing protein [Oscillatoriaceae cyanobacterium]
MPDWLSALAVLSALAFAAIAALLVALRVNVRYHLERAGSLCDPDFASTLQGLTNSPSRSVTSYRLYTDVPSIYTAMLQAIHQAERTITMETYLFWSGRTAEAFIQAFIERAQAGVEVKLLLDADGSRFLKRKAIARLKAGGCEVRLFRPFSWTQPVAYNHRTHRKLLVIDGVVGFTGGIGVADMWFGPPPWLDLMLRLEGGVVELLQGAFFQDWVIAGGGLNLGRGYFPLAPEAQITPEGPQGMVTTSAPIWGDSTMRLLYFSAIASAEQRIWLASPYFLPNWDTAAALGAAALRGVEVRLLLPGPRNDKPFPYYASRRLYGTLLAAGVAIYEYQPAMMHAKAMLIDDRWVTLGSTNFDPRSFFLNSELNTTIADPGFAREMSAFFEGAFADSRRITLEDWYARPWRERIGAVLGLLFKDQL